jgi:serine/threonine protein kinase
MQSMHDLLTHSRTVPSDVIQSCLAQIVALLVTAQARDPGFAHNDFKADNILLCLESRPSPIAIGDFEVAHVGVRVVLIDLETVTGNSFPPVHLPDLPRDKLEVFGIDPSMPWCEWTDFHLLCMDLFRSVRSQKPKWAQACLEFLAACCPTLRMFFTYEDKNILVTSMNRLSTKGRKTVNALLDARAMKHLTEVAELPFLAPWLTHQNSKAAAEMSETIPTQTPMDNETT